MTVIESLERMQIRDDVPEFRPGDTVRVHFQVIEGQRRRVQVFEGTVIKRQGASSRETFTVRKQSFGVGVERTFPVHSPKIDKIERTLDQRSQIAIAKGSIALGDLVADCIEAAVDAVMARYELPWDDVAFARLEGSVRGEAPGVAADALAVAADIIGAGERVRKRTRSLTAAALRPTVGDVEGHLARLVSPGFVRRSGTDRLPDLHRYLRGIEYRLDHLAGDVARDQRRMADVRPLEREYLGAVAGLERVTDEARRVVWLLEEYRLSVFAQPVGVDGPVSPKRIRRQFEQATGIRLP